MDADGILGQESTVTIKFSRACSVWLESDSMIDIPLELTLEELAICTSVSDYHIRISGESVTSLLPLQDLQVWEHRNTIIINNFCHYLRVKFSDL